MSAKSPIRIRLARFGRRHQPLYNIVVLNKKQARDKVPIEVLGTYNPVPISEGVKGTYKDIQLDFDRSQYWIGVGADVSDRVGFLFKRAGLLPEEWPNPNKLSQHITKPVIDNGKTVYEEAKELYRRRE